MMSKHTFLERIFRVLFIIMSSICIIVFVSNQWRRYQNPVIFTIETSYQNWKFYPVGVTVCSNYIATKTIENVILTIWNIEPTHKEYEIYSSFAITIALTKYYNLDNFQPFVNDSRFSNINLLQIATLMRGPLLKIHSNIYTSVINEMGICYTNSKLHNLQKPYNIFDAKTNISAIQPPIPEHKVYYSFDAQFEQTVMSQHNESDNIIVFIHSLDDVINLNETLNQQIQKSKKQLISLTLMIKQFVANRRLQNLPVHVRKCLYSTESSAALEYFPIHTTNLCKIACRVKEAIKLCGCIPFFYSVDSSAPACNVTGMYCLSQTLWYQSKCKCYPLCESIDYIKTTAKISYMNLLESILGITVLVPRHRYRREVIYYFHDFIASIGGAAALFLGASCISVIETIYRMIQFIIHLLHGSISNGQFWMNQ